MADLRKSGSTSNLVRFTLKDKTTGQGKTGLSISTTGLVISTIADNETSATTYTVAGSTIETIATLGTFATPTATKCRFKAVDATNHPGLYEFQVANARFSVSSAKRLVISVNDAGSTILDTDYEIEFVDDLTAAVWSETTRQLTATGLDLITATDPGVVASTFPQMMVQVWRRFFKKTAKATSGLTIKTYADDGITVRTTQTYTDDGAGNQMQNAAT